jgi:nucleotide-binding universal stress UspA family protein
MKSILVPTDFSECSASAYSYAVMLAEKTKATIYLLHVLDVPFPSQSVNGSEASTRLDTHFMMELMKLTKARMSKVRNGKVFKNLNVQEVIEVGSISDKVLNAVKKYKADMIIMGTHGVNGFQEKFIGTNAEKVVRNAEIPVLSVKHNVKNPKLETIVLATDFSKEAEQVLPVVSNIADLLKARLILTKVVTPNRFETTSETNQQLEKFRNKNKLYNYSTGVYYADSKEEGIRNAAEAADADVIALGTHGRHGLAHFFRGSIAEDVVSHASLPVLTMNFHKKLMSSKAAVEGRKIRQYNSDLLYQIPSV